MPSQRAGVHQQRTAESRQLLVKALTRELPTKHTFIHFSEDLHAKVALERSATCPQNFAPAEVISKPRRPQSPSPAFDASDWTEASSLGLGGRRPLLGGSLRLILAQKEAAAAAAAASAASGGCVTPSPAGAPGSGSKRSNAGASTATASTSSPSSATARAAKSSPHNTAAAETQPEKAAVLESASLAPCADEVEDDSTEAATGTSLAGSEEESESQGRGQASREQTRSPTGPCSKGSSGIVEDDGWTQVPTRKKGTGSRQQMPATALAAAASCVAEVAEVCGEDARSRQEDAGHPDMDAFRQTEQELLAAEFEEQPDEPWEQQRDRRDRRQKQRRQAQQVENAPATTDEADLEGAASSSSAYRQGDCSGYEAANGWWNRSSYGDGAWPRRSVVRYEVGIPQCEEYNVMRRLLVPSGGHMRRVAEVTGAKLCVRGKGSGHLEGLEKKEAPEPLMVCITSSMTADVPKACQMVEQLLRELQTEYGEIKRKKGEPVPEIRIARI
eukprot:TRINITY_DN33126_c0_g1_i1.p1 TRINITY_DN33126_c0_g1~~TRINITY_DN33126_c0_g1_i1.p1  ORF type:complete len:502 (+),score=120.50 TRINITY_DN33126_c0_g1_i1:175-1680(+)